MPTALPYDDYSWTFSQHAIAINERNLLGLLNAAHRFSGSIPTGETRKALNQYIIQNNILTQNVREGIADPWRDYQQILAELGLIVSTKLSREIMITPIGLALLDDPSRYAEILTAQALKYQYPNGFKHTFIDQQVANGVFVKPAILILKTLLQLKEAEDRPFLTVDEIQEYVFPCARISQQVDISAIIRNRNSGSRMAPQHQHARRNIQDWIEFLSKTALFDRETSGAITLSFVANRQSTQLHELVDLHEKTAWVPTSNLERDRWSWFEHYGSITFAEEEALDAQEIVDLPHELVDETDTPVSDTRRALNLREVTLARAIRPTNAPLQITPKSEDELRAQYQATEKQSKLHDLIVQEIAHILRGQGVAVYEDPSSVDILGIKEEQESILEVKTITPRNRNNRIRLGAGQLLEYQYRRKIEHGSAPEIALVLSSEVSDSWLRNFFNQHLQAALIMRIGNGRYKVWKERSSSIVALLESA